MTEHFRSRAQRARVSTDACCGFGALALRLHAGGNQAQRRLATIRWPQSRRTDHAKAKSVIFLFMAGGPSHLETFDPKPLLNKLDGQKRPAEFGEAKYQFVQADARSCSARSGPSRSTARAASRSPTCFPHRRECVDDLAVIRSCHGDMVVHSAAQYQLLTGRVDSRFSQHGLVGALRPGLGERIAAGLRRDARPEGASKPASRCTRNGFLAGRLSADDVPARREARAQSRPAQGRDAWRSAARRST